MHLNGGECDRGDFVIRFAGFKLDQQRAELQGPDGGAIKLRPKTFDLLVLFAGRPKRILSKQELMEAVWPNIHVGEDSLFQCIRELRAALGDERREMVKLVSGRGYMLDAEVTTDAPVGVAPDVPAPDAAPRSRVPFSRSVIAAVLLAAVVGLAVAAPLFKTAFSVKRTPVIAILMPAADEGQDPHVAATAMAMTDRLTDGLARVDTIRVVAPAAAKQSTDLAAATQIDADYVISNELTRSQQTWTLRTRMIKSATGEVEAMPAVTIDGSNLDADLLQTRLAAGVGHLLAARINALVDAEAMPAHTASRQSAVKAAIEQANESIMNTSRDRFAAAQKMLERALADDPGHIDLQVALAAMQMRGIQMAWYSAEESIAAEKNAQDMLERVLRAKPTSIPALEAYCRFLNATNQFVESLVACARTLASDPWNGMALYHMGVAHLQLGRFEDALATFKRADRFDTPQVSRWTWLLGIGWSYVMMGEDEKGLPWLERSIAITPASGRPLMLLAAAYHRAGRSEDARRTLARALTVRPGSTATNIALPPKNASPAFLAWGDKIKTALIEIGLPER